MICSIPKGASEKENANICKRLKSSNCYAISLIRNFHLVIWNDKSRHLRRLSFIWQKCDYRSLHVVFAGKRFHLARSIKLYYLFDNPSSVHHAAESSIFQENRGKKQVSSIWQLCRLRFCCKHSGSLFSTQFPYFCCFLRWLAVVSICLFFC